MSIPTTTERLYYTQANLSDKPTEADSPSIQARTNSAHRLLEERTIQQRAWAVANPDKVARSALRLWTHEEGQREWVVAHVWEFLIVYDKDALPAFWSSLQDRFVQRHPLCFEARDKGISVAQYLVQTIHVYMQDEGLLACREISTEEAAVKFFEHLGDDQ
ncbi:hypothetical protein C8J56DRAFT_1040421 [Mycena floridula]|nr:hypothetical protein C8J56DRAFT_1040421 [Mycena floridula]